MSAKNNSKRQNALTWKEERFVDSYIDNGGNATQAYRAAHPGCLYSTANTEGPQWLAKPNIQQTIEEIQKGLRDELKIDRNKILRVYAAMAFATMDDFAEVAKNPHDRESYSGLGLKRMAIESVSRSPKNCTHIKLVNRLAVLNELWDKLGFKNLEQKNNGEANHEAILAAISRLLNEDPTK